MEREPVYLLCGKTFLCLLLTDRDLEPEELLDIGEYFDLGHDNLKEAHTLVVNCENFEVLDFLRKH